MRKNKVVKLDAGGRMKRHQYVGPITFTGRCELCREPRNRHCGRCHGCPGHHVPACLLSAATGAWH